MSDTLASFRLSPQQERLVGDAAGAVCSCTFRLAEPLDESSLRARVEALVARHEILRTAFVRPAGLLVPQQAVYEPSDPERARVLTAELADGGSTLTLTAPAANLDAQALVLLAAEIVRPRDDEPLQYADYAEWRAAMLEEAGDDARGFWQVSGARPRLLFGSGAPASGSVEREPVDLPADAKPALLEAAWHALLARLTGETEVLLAGEVDGRGQPDLAGAVGAYAQHVPVRTRIEAGTTLAEVIDQVERARAAARGFQDAADTADLRALGAAAIAGFSFLDGGTARIADVTAPLAPLVLELRARSDADGLAAEIAFDPAAYDREDAADLSRRYALAVGAALARPAISVEGLPLVSPVERAELLDASAGPVADYAFRPVHTLVQKHARSTPAAPAVSDGASSLSYAELDAAANRLARHLGDAGVQPGARVGICLERSTASIVALLAVLKSGAAYVPLNFEHPRERLAHQLAETEAAVLVTQESLLDRLPEHGSVVCLDRDAAAIAARDATAPDVAVSPTDLAYVVYTSGSTGLPKGVGVTHGNLANYIGAIRAVLDADGARFGVVSALSTDLGNTAIFPALAGGGCVQVVPPGDALDSGAFAALNQAQPIDVLKITPSHLRALLAGDEPAAVLPRRWLVLGGEALSWELVERVRATGARCRILNHYGPTETTIGTCTFLVEGGGDGGVPIGRPLANTTAFVLDAALEPLPAGVPGELWVGGAGVASGYVARPDESAERFVDTPFGRLYRTGDRVRRLRGAEIQYLGRADDQVKIRGNRIEPSEVAAVLAGHPSVRQAAVVAREDAGGELQLVAYLVASAAPSVEELRAFLARSLPEFMIPSVFATLDALPLTASGKVDRHALPDPAEVQAQREAAFVAPRDDLEAEIAAIWEELLGIERVGVADDFFALGGHSLLATQMVIRIRRTHGEIPLHALLAAPTVAAVADVVRSGAKS